MTTRISRISRLLNQCEDNEAWGSRVAGKMFSVAVHEALQDRLYHFTPHGVWYGLGYTQWDYHKDNRLYAQYHPEQEQFYVWQREPAGKSSGQWMRLYNVSAQKQWLADRFDGITGDGLVSFLSYEYWRRTGKTLTIKK